MIIAMTEKQEEEDSEGDMNGDEDSEDWWR